MTFCCHSSSCRNLGQLTKFFHTETGFLDISVAWNDRVFYNFYSLFRRRNMMFETLNCFSGHIRWIQVAYQCLSHRQAALAHLAIALACQSRGPPIAASRHVFGASVSMPSSLATLWWRHGKHGAWAAATIGIPWEGGLSILLSTIWNMFDGI